MNRLCSRVKATVSRVMIAVMCGLFLLNVSLAQEAHTEETHAAESSAHEAGKDAPKLGELLHPASVAPFAALLLCIAIFPLANPHWWEHNRNKGFIALGLGIPVALYLVTFGHDGQHALQHAAQEYVSFLLLLGSLFVISGGIYVRGSVNGTPFVNTAFLGFGALIASFIGTTGASMLLIRPLLRANASRSRVAHVVVFFIFIVSNCGGLLTPLGDPPLFLGFLKGVPFEWTLRLFREWAFVNASLLVIFFVWDSIAARSDAKDLPATPVLVPGEGTSESRPIQKGESFGIEGGHNFLGLAAIVAIIYSAGQGYGHEILSRLFPGHHGGTWPFGVGEALMATVMLACYAFTAKATREKNRFGFGPIIEVAVLFAGIFVTMIPALQILNVQGKNLGIESPAQFFWASGILSSFLDNAPTYLTFAATACGIKGINTGEGRYLAEFLALPPEAGAAALLAAISCGSVFMGANTYIGNGPNFMVKAIAEENNVRMPGFFGYMAYSVGILIPVFIVVTFLFFAK